MFIKNVTPKDFGFNYKSFKCIKSARNKKENLNEFIKVCIGRGNKELKQMIAMEVALNLLGLEIIDDLKKGADLALEIINADIGIKVLEDLVAYSGGDIQKFNNLVNLICKRV